MKTILEKLISGATFSRDEMKDILVSITEQKYSNEQIAGLLTGLQMRSITVDELLGLRDGILETGKPVDLSPYKVVDIVGTGGDGKNTFNISTCSCFVVAGAGYKVAKHGNYSATSVSGAGNVLEEHGVKFTADNDKLKNNIEKCNFTYMHAPLFAYAMKFVAPVRKALQVPTCFNLLGPIVNPCRPQYQVLGTATLDQMRLYHSVLQQISEGYSIVTSLDVYDEISLTKDFKVISSNMEQVFSCTDIGFERINPADIYGGSTKQEAKKIFDDVLSNTATAAQKNVVLANSAFSINCICPEKNIHDCFLEAKESLESGKALNALKKYVEMNS
ncbi:MAG: anthranilate phosphoribosyltransferase [Bacteroidales bacterium]|nr:anthranilate phosphoribosyltransferase [Bacteroidales bacterium]